MRVRAVFKWISLALLGIVIAAGVSIAASRLASQQIGLASEPITAGDALAPPPAKQVHRPKRPKHRAKTAPTTPPTVPPTTTVTVPPPVVPPPLLPTAPTGGEGGSGGGDGEHGGGGGGGADD